MEKNEFEQIDPLIDEISEQVSDLIEGETLERLKAKMSEISEILGEPYSLTLEINLQVFDSDRENSLPLLQTGLSTNNGSPAYQCWGDSSPHRYVVTATLRLPNYYLIAWLRIAAIQCPTKLFKLPCCFKPIVDIWIANHGPVAASRIDIGKPPLGGIDRFQKFCTKPLCKKIPEIRLPPLMARSSANTATRKTRCYSLLRGQRKYAGSSVSTGSPGRHQHASIRQKLVGRLMV